MKRNWLTSLSGRVAKRLDVHRANEEKLERARRENELVEQQRQREIEAAQLKVARKREKSEAKLKQKETDTLQKLNSHVTESVRSGIIAKKVRSYADIATFQDEVSTFFAQIKAVHGDFEFETSNNCPNYQEIAAHIAKKPHIILRGSEGLSAADAIFFKDYGLDVKDLRWPACEGAFDVNKALATFFDIGGLSNTKRDEALTAELRHSDLDKSPFKIRARFVEHNGAVQCSMSCKGYGFETSLELRHRVMEDLLRWVVDLDVEKAKDLEERFAKLGHDLNVSEHHMRVHGHTQFMPKETDDADSLKEKFEARMAASAPRLLKVAGSAYDLLPRPANTNYIDQVAKQLRALDGATLSDGQRLSVSYVKSKGKFKSITIDVNNRDHSFSSSLKRFEVRWVAAKDTFDIMKVEGDDVTTFEGPIESRFDEQYHFLHAQIGQWLQQQYEQLAKDFFEANPIYATPKKFAVAGYKTPKLLS